MKLLATAKTLSGAAVRLAPALIVQASMLFACGFSLASCILAEAALVALGCAIGRVCNRPAEALRITAPDAVRSPGTVVIFDPTFSRNRKRHAGSRALAVAAPLWSAAKSAVAALLGLAPVVAVQTLLLVACGAPLLAALAAELALVLLGMAIRLVWVSTDADLHVTPPPVAPAERPTVDVVHPQPTEIRKAA